MPDVPIGGAKTAGGSSDGLVPLPKRVAVGDDETIEIEDPIKFVSDLIERAAHLVSTLDHDVEGLKSDQAEERLRIESTWEAQQTRAEQAIEQLATLKGVAVRLAQRKNRPELLEAGLARSRITNFPFDETTSFEEYVEAISVEVRTAKGITGLIRLEGIGELLAGATRAVARMLADADKTKRGLLHQTQDELTAERKEARASFEIGLQVLRRDLELLSDATPLSSRSWDDPGWEERQAGPIVPCLVRLGSYVHPRLRNTPIPALFHVPGGAPIRIDPGPHRDEMLRSLRSLLLRALWAATPGGLGITIIDPKGSSEGIRTLVQSLRRSGAAASMSVSTSEEDIEQALTLLVERNERVDAEILGASYRDLTECNVAAGEIVEPWHLLVVLDHPGGLSDTATKLVHSLLNGGTRAGLTTVITTDPIPAPAFTPDGRPRVRTPLPIMQTFKVADGDLSIDLGRAGRWTVELDDSPSDTDAAALLAAVMPSTGPSPSGGPDGFARLLRAASSPSGDRRLPALSGPIERNDPSTWWGGTTATGIGLPLGRASAMEALVLELDSDQFGSALVTSLDDAALDEALSLVIDDVAVLYRPDEVQLVCVSVQGRSSFDGCIESRLPHARLIAVDAETTFSVAVLEGLAAELARRRGSNVLAPRIVVIVKGFVELVSGTARTHVRGTELLDNLLTHGHRYGIHLILADREVPSSVVDALPSLRRCRSRLRVASRRALTSGIDASGPGDHGEERAAPAEGGARLSLPATDSSLHDDTVTTLTTPAGTTTLSITPVAPSDHEQLLWEVRGLAQDVGELRPPQIYDGHAPARLDHSGLERIASNAGRRAERLKPRFWLGDPTTMGGPVELLLRRADGANLLVITDDELTGRGMVLAAITTAALNHGDSLELLVADFLPPETGFSESAAALEACGAISVTRRRHFDKMLHRVKRIVSDRHATSAFTEPPVLLVLSGIGRARDLDIDPHDPESVERHHTIEDILRDGPEVGVHTLAWCEAPATLSRRLSRNELREFSYRAVGPLDPDISRGLTGSEAAASLGPHQALLYDEDTGRTTRFRPYRPTSPEWLTAVARRAGLAD